MGNANIGRAEAFTCSPDSVASAHLLFCTRPHNRKNSGETRVQMSIVLINYWAPNSKCLHNDPHHLSASRNQNRIFCRQLPIPDQEPRQCQSSAVYFCANVYTGTCMLPAYPASYCSSRQFEESIFVQHPQRLTI